MAATYSSLNLSSVCDSAGLGKTVQQSCSCRCFNRPASTTLFGGYCNKCPLRPTCRMRSRTYHKKTRARKAPGERPPFDQESQSVEDGKEMPELVADVDNVITTGDAGEHSNGVSLLELKADASGDDNQQLKGAGAAHSSSLESLSKSSSNSEEESFIDIVEDLLYKVKDAERNILMLNEVRMQNLEELEQVHSERDKLEGQVNVLQVQLAEADAKGKLASQEKAKIKLLEEELEALQAKLQKSSDAEVLMAELNAGCKKLSEENKILQARVDTLHPIEARSQRLKVENEALQEEMRSLQADLADVSTKAKLITQLQTEKESLQVIISELESKLAIAESNALELANMKAERQIILEKLQKSERESPTIHMSKYTVRESVADNQGLQEKVGELRAALDALQAENELLNQAQEENKFLQEQIKMLEQKLAKSDAEIRSQLDVYQAEVEAFQNILEQLKSEKGTMGLEDVADDMPWEFWSHLLLQIDGWMLENKVSPDDAAVLRQMAWRRDLRIKDAFIANRSTTDHDLISGLLDLLKEKKRPGMHIVHIAAEMAPVAKVGGLGDVVTGLGKSLQRKGHLVEVVLPKYDCMDYNKISNLKVLNLDLLSYFDGHMFKNKVWLGTVEGLPIYFIEPHHPEKFFWRGQVYGENDDFRRFTYFCRAALEFILQAKKKPDIIHCHDWHTAAVAPMYWDLYAPQGLDSARVAFTCHNFEYQGTESAGTLACCGLNPQQLHRVDRMQDNVVHSRINLLKGGIVFSNIVTTVSPTYALEVQTPEGGKGLQSTLMAHSHKFFGILNGIDTEAWNPASDSFIDYQYSAEDISGKAANKATLRARLGLSTVGLDSERPIVGCITRLVPQKGVHLIRHAIYRTLDQGGQFILLGSSPIRDIQNEFQTIAQQFNHHPHVRLILKYDDSLSHSIYAAADVFVIPSIFEPCGLTQMIAMRYGAIPVARRTGGLNDSVFDVDDETIPLQRRNGYTFSGVNEESLNHALDRALSHFFQRRESWKDLVKKAMQMDFSWNSSADQYVELYQRAMARARANH